MTWWAWTMIWVVLVLGAGFVIFRIGLSLWRKASALLTELSAAADRLSAVFEELEAVTTGQPEPAVFADPRELRRQRYLASRRTGRTGRGRQQRGRSSNRIERRPESSDDPPGVPRQGPRR